MIKLTAFMFIIIILNLSFEIEFLNNLIVFLILNNNESGQ